MTKSYLKRRTFDQSKKDATLLSHTRLSRRHCWPNQLEVSPEPERKNKEGNTRHHDLDGTVILGALREAKILFLLDSSFFSLQYLLPTKKMNDGMTISYQKQRRKSVRGDKSLKSEMDELDNGRERKR